MSDCALAQAALSLLSEISVLKPQGELYDFSPHLQQPILGVCDPDSPFPQKGTGEGGRNVDLETGDTLLALAFNLGCWADVEQILRRCTRKAFWFKKGGVSGNEGRWKAEISTMDLLQKGSPVHRKPTAAATTLLGQGLAQTSSLGGRKGNAAPLVMQDLFSVLGIDFPFSSIAKA